MARDAAGGVRGAEESRDDESSVSSSVAEPSGGDLVRRSGLRHAMYLALALHTLRR